MLIFRPPDADREAIAAPADDQLARCPRDRHGFTRDHGFIDRTATFEKLAADWHFFTGAHAQTIADLDLIEANIFVRTVRPDTPRGFRREIEQRPDRAAGLRAGA